MGLLEGLVLKADEIIPGVDLKKLCDLIIM